jgi:hypothetical protein
MRRLGALGCAIVVAVAMAACSSDDGDGDSRAGGRAEDEQSSAPVRMATLNLLHGLFCPPETDACQAPDRVQIFTELVEAAECPELIGLQEIGERLEQLLPDAVGSMCDGEYSIEWEGVASPDRQMVLTRLPVLEQGYLDIANFPWEAYWVRVRSSQGPVDFLSAHFASSTNNPICAPDRCPPICPPTISTNECHAAEVVEFFARRDGAAITIASGDFNARPGEPTIVRLLDAGFVDAWLEARNPECDPATHVGCTGGGTQPEPFVGMNTVEGPGFDERIDFVMARGGRGCELGIDAEGFAVEPRDEPLNGMWWPADHGGVLAEMRCT